MIGGWEKGGDRGEGREGRDERRKEKPRWRGEYVWKEKLPETRKYHVHTIGL